MEIPIPSEPVLVTTPTSVRKESAYTAETVSEREWPSIPEEQRWVVGLMQDRLKRTDQSPQDLKARAAELRLEAKRTDIDAFREAALALADRYDQAASRLASA